MQAGLAASLPTPTRRILVRQPLLPSADGKPVVPVTIGRQLVRLQIDTGAETSALSEQGAARLRLRPGAPWRGIAGLGGVAAVPTASLHGLSFGGATWPNLRLPVMPLPLAPGVDGLIGADLLAGFVVGLDFPAGTLVLGRVLPPELARSTLSFLPGLRFPVVSAWLGTHRLPALLDTGAGGSAIDLASAGIPPASLAQDPVRRGSGAAGLAVPARMHRFDNLALGGTPLGGLTLQVTRLAPVLPMRLVLGMDVLRGRQLWVDYPRARLTLA